MTVQVMGGGSGGNIQVANTINVGGLVLSTAGLIILVGNVVQGVGGTYSGLWNASFGVTASGTAYTPSGALAFYLRAAAFRQSTAVSASNVGIQLLSNDVAVAIGGQIAALTNPRGMISQKAGSTTATPDWVFSKNTLELQEIVVGGKVPNGKFATLQNSACEGTVMLYGYEA